MLLLTQISGNGKGPFRHLLQQIAACQPGLSQVAIVLRQSLHGLFVLRLDVRYQGQRLAQHRIQRLFEIGGTAFHAFQEVRLVQCGNGHLLNHRPPLVRHDHHLLLVVLQGPFVQLGNVRIGTIEELHDDTPQVFLAIQDVLEVKQFHQQMAVVFVLQRRQLFNAALCGLLLVRYVAVHTLVADDGLRGNLRGQHHTLQRLATAQGHIHLPGGKRQAGIDDGPFEGQSLTLMDGDGPRQPQGQLRELPQHLGLNLARHVVQRVAGILPLQRFHLDGLAVALAIHLQPVVLGQRHVSDAPVIVAVFPRGVVLHEHHLCALLQHQRLRRGVRIVRKRPFNPRPIGIGTRGEFLQLRLVIVVRHLVVRGQPDVALLGLGSEGRLTASVQQRHILLGGLTLANVVQQRQKRVVLLPVHLLQLDGHIVNLRQRLRTEEVRRVVIRCQHALVLGGHHRRQLLQVANHQQLYPAKGLIAVAEPAQHAVDGVQQVAAHHRYLVNDQQVQRRDDFPLLLAEIKLRLNLRTRHEGREGQLEERMDGHAPRIDGRHTRRCHHDAALAAVLHHRLQERRLSRAGLTRQEDATPRVLHEVPGMTQFPILLHCPLHLPL